MAAVRRGVSPLSLITPLEHRTIGAIATTQPGAAGLLRGLGIVVCRCALDRTLAAEAAAMGMPLGALVAALRDRAEVALGEAPDATDALIGHIVARYHERHRAELPGLIAMAAEIESAEAARHEAPRGLADLLEGLRAGLEEHMLREERRIFPAMLDDRRDQLTQPLALMRDEHEDNALFLLRAEHLTQGFRAPAGHAAWERLYADLARFAEDLVAHVFLEERKLFPRFEAADQGVLRPHRS